MFRAGLLMLFTNILIIAVLTIVINLLGLDPYVNAYAGDYSGLFIFCLIWGMGGSFISLAISRWMAKRAYGVQLVTQNSPYGHIVNRVYHFSKKAGLPEMPEVGIYDSPDINAFATGPSKSKSLVAVSTGLLHQMNDEEIDGVLAHEVAHIANGDMVTMTLLQGVMNAFVMFAARVIATVIDNAMKDDNGRGGLGMFAHMMVVIVLQIVFGILAQFVIAAFSRYREYRADEGGAKLAGKQSMVNALKKLKQKYEPAGTFENDSMAAFKISGGRMFKLLSTHPPLTERIKALS